MKTTYEYGVYVRKDGHLEFMSAVCSYSEARDIAAGYLRQSDFVFIVAFPNRLVNLRYSPKIWRVRGSFRGVQCIPYVITEFIRWI